MRREMKGRAGILRREKGKGRGEERRGEERKGEERRGEERRGEERRGEGKRASDMIGKKK